jgi:phosphoenolpyruvate-protein phosphotransferase
MPHPREARIYQGTPASSGIACGPAFLYHPPRLKIEITRRKGTAEEEWQRVAQALAKANEQLAGIYEKVRLEVGEEDAAIFLAHREMLKDPQLRQDVQKRIGEGASAEEASRLSFEMFAGMLRALKDPYLSARAADLEDVARRVMALLLGVQNADTPISGHPSIIVAEDLSPSDTARLDRSMTLGFCTGGGGPSSHSAILARSMGIPCVVGLGAALNQIEGGASLILDGDHGTVMVDPDEETLARYKTMASELAARRAQMKQAAQVKAQTADGKPVEIVANIGSVEDADAALENGAEGVGLFRTEFLYLDRAQPPSEEEQYSIYRRVAEKMGQRPVVIRTMDFGGDKPVPYLDLPSELNPFLGCRGIRLALKWPDLFLTQVRAILRASPGHNLKMMFPMVSSPEEIDAAQGVVAQARKELDRDGIPYDRKLEVGIMVEVPSAAVLADTMGAQVDFFSIGTNDLTQYTLAADRGNALVANLSDALHPAVLRLIRQVVEGAHRHGRWVGLCGELGGDPAAIPVLIGLGLDELSMNAPSVPEAKRIVRQLKLAEAQIIAQQVLDLPNSGAARQAVGEWLVRMGIEDRLKK